MKVAVVTGSTRGIGLGIATGLGRAGWAVLLNHLRAAAPARAASKAMEDADHAVVRADVRRPDGAKRLVDAALRRWGRLDLLVANVGDFVPTPVSRLELDKFDAMHDSNVRATLNSVKAALPALRKSRGSVVVLGGTVSGLLRGNPAYAAYAMAKASLVVLARSLAQAEGPRGVRVNMVCPGFIRTWAYSDLEVASLAPKVPLRRLGDPAEIASVVEFLASDRASYVSGAVIDVGGGLWV